MLPSDETAEKQFAFYQARSFGNAGKGVCPECGHLLGQEETMCSFCGCPIKYFRAAGKSKCPDCGTEIPKGAKNCPVCGCPCSYFIPVDEETKSIPDDEPVENDYIEEPFAPDEEYDLNDPELYEPYENDDVDGSWESVCNYGYCDSEEEDDVNAPEYDESDYPDYSWEDVFDEYEN